MATDPSAVEQYLSDLTGLPETAVRFALLGWQQLPIEVGERVVGTLLHRTGEIHVAFHADYRGHAFPRAAAVRMLGPLLDIYGVLTTRIPHGARWAYARRYVMRLGFRPHTTMHDETHYIMDRIPYERTGR